jgi:hypothetical protein
MRAVCGFGSLSDGKKDLRFLVSRATTVHNCRDTHLGDSMDLPVWKL